MTAATSQVGQLRSSADHPTLASFEDVHSYQLHLAVSGAGVPTLGTGHNPADGLLSRWCPSVRQTASELSGAQRGPERECLDLDGFELP
jgi:hypothetical protein